jgi:hypothetical protein
MVPDTHDVLDVHVPDGLGTSEASKELPLVERGGLIVRPMSELPGMIAIDLPILLSDHDVINGNISAAGEPATKYIKLHKAYELLGGEKVVKQALIHGEEQLQLSLHRRPLRTLEDDSYVEDAQSMQLPRAPMIIGEREKCCGLVIKLRRKKNWQALGERNNTEVSVVAKVIQRYVFNDPADYQVPL